LPLARRRCRRPAGGPLEWLFQYEEAHPLLAWIFSCLRPSNVLSPSHLSQYEQLVEEGRLLEGSHSFVMPWKYRLKFPCCQDFFF
uniref:HAUS augmin-like complex subunit 3 N-terminal domain-containing protein n=1 Tax=Triticum urartu TaxID=4572 RepID=A0A8R7Q5D7_TRIUA